MSNFREELLRKLISCQIQALQHNVVDEPYLNKETNEIIELVKREIVGPDEKLIEGETMYHIKNQVIFDHNHLRHQQLAKLEEGK
jgi:hypothetical protein